MNSTNPSLRSRKLWAKREDKCLAILNHGLLLLLREPKLPEAEIELNRKLYFCLLTASRELYPKEDIAPISECNNQCDPDDNARVAREQKRPDFQWVYLDRYESDPHRSSRQFVVECKRLGSSSRADWILNLNYVQHGILRFRQSEWGYAKRFSRAVMVGYWQSMDGSQVLNEVNLEAKKNSIPDIVLVGPWQPKAVSKLFHCFDRSFDVSPFVLNHLWVDLRCFCSGNG